MNINSHCYRFDYIRFDNGLLDKIIDAVYVILLENSDRTENVYKQINHYKLSKNTYIQINKGYKNCEKKLMKQQSNYDLLDSNYNIWLHAKENNYNNILILEDDFIFDNRILDKNILNDLDNFVNNYEFDIYSLGNTPIILTPFLLTKHPKISIGSGAHSIILTKGIRNILIDKYENDIDWLKNSRGHIDWIYITNNFNYHIYYKPLCYQIFPKTENMAYWDQDLNIIYKILIKLNIFLIPLLKLDKQPQPGFDIIYIFSYTLSISLYLLIIYVIYRLYKKIKYVYK
tara:strand:- start:3965 stop:4825 length:861 start_codon:yes stop_codon:yes gene_type:complete